MAVKKTITYRWFVYGFSMIAAVLLVAAAAAVMLLRSYYYQSVEDVLSNRAQLYRRSLVIADAQPESFEKAALAFVENFDLKEQMELQVLSETGTILASSTGFVPPQNDALADFLSAKVSPDGSVTGDSHNGNGEHVMALTTVQTNADGTVLGALRYVVTMRLIDRQLLFLSLLIGFAVLLVLFFSGLSSLYFIRSIVHPVEEIGRAARRIAEGDYAYRVVKHSTDEIGELCDTINYMAGEIQHAEQLKNDFISSVSHELRTPLTAIRGWSETLQQTGSEDRDTLERGMQIIAEETDRLSGMVEELLDFSRMQNGRLTLRFEPVDVVALIEELLFFFRDRAEKQGVWLHCTGRGRLPLISGDPDRLRQVFINILDNAMKYTAAGDVIQVDYAAVDKAVQVVVGDTGSGIPAADLPMVKKKFYKADTTHKGSGIGLAMADEIITGHGGTLELVSKEGIGTSVIVTIPVS